MALSLHIKIIYMSQRSFYIKTFGCQMNVRDSEIMAQTLSRHGSIETMDMESADIIILNTCSIRAKAEQKVMSLLGYLRKTKKKNPGLKICVAGCVAQQEGKQLLARMDHVDLVVGTQNIYQIDTILQEAKKSKVIATNLANNYEIPQFIPALPQQIYKNRQPQEAVPRFSKFVTIMQGCNNYCTYCVVPYTRGREVSRKYNDILDEVKVLVESGVKEITLLGQNVNSYGQTNLVRDGNTKTTFSDLLRAVSEIKGLQRLRCTTSNPKDLTNDLMKCFGEIENLCPQFHLPVQSGSNSILRRMNRNYTVETYLEQVETLRSYRPDICITTDMIIGFPGESDEDFEQTMSLLNTVGFHGSFSFKYSDRPGTRSADFTDKVEENVKSMRLQRFQKRQDEFSLEKNQQFVGHNMELLVEKINKDGFAGRTVTNHIVHVKGIHNMQPGDLCQADIIHGGPHSLRGSLKP